MDYPAFDCSKTEKSIENQAETIVNIVIQDACYFNEIDINISLKIHDNFLICHHPFCLNSPPD